MKNKITNIIKSTLSLLVIISILLSNPVYAEEMRLNSGVKIPITYLDSNRFEITNNVYSGKKLLFSKGTTGSKNIGRVVDVYGQYHYFSTPQISGKKPSRRLGKNGPKVLPLVGAVAATAIAVPVSAFLVVVDCATTSCVHSAGVGLLPFVPSVFLAKKAFEED